MLLPAVVGVVLLGLVMLMKLIIGQFRYCCEARADDDPNRDTEDDDKKTVPLDRDVEALADPKYHQPVKPDEIEMDIS